MDIKHILSHINGVSLKAKTTFTRSLALIVKSGMSLPQGLEILAEQTGSSLLKQTVREIKNAVTKGESFAETLRTYPGVFSTFYVSMVKTGEVSGNLERVLNDLAIYLEKERALRSRVLGALIYPAVIFFVMLAVITLMMIVVVPRLATVFAEFDAQLPKTTLIIIAVSKIVTNYALVALPTVLILAVGAWYTVNRTKQGKHAFDWLVLHVPVCALLSSKINSARISRALQILITSGVPIVEALTITSEVVKNSFYQDALKKAAKEIEGGRELNAILAEDKKLFTPLMTELIAIGQETGSLDVILGELADSYEDEVERITKNLPSLIEPALMIFIGSTVGFLAISMLQPIYTLTNAINY